MSLANGMLLEQPENQDCNKFFKIVIMVLFLLPLMPLLFTLFFLLWILLMPTLM